VKDNILEAILEKWKDFFGGMVGGEVWTKIEKYRKLPYSVSTQCKDAYAFWVLQAKDFPHFSRLARAIFKALVSVTAVNIVFSVAAGVDSTTSNSIAPETFEQRLFVRCKSDFEGRFTKLATAASCNL